MKKLLFLLLITGAVNANAQNIGIGTNTPEASALLDVSSTTKGVLLPRMTTLERTSIAGPSIGLTVFDTDTYSFWIYRGDVNGGWAEIVHQYQKAWNINGNNIYNNNAGNVGIGTSSPQEKLSINASNPSIQFLHNSVAKGFLQVSTNDVRIGTYANNSTGNLVLSTKGLDRAFVDENGNIGIGTSTPSELLTINGTDPVLQMRNANVNKGYIKAMGDDLLFATNIGNTLGDLVFQTNGAEHIRLASTGNLGIGFSNPTAKLYVNTTSTTEPALRVLVNSSTKFMVAPNGGVSVGAYDITPPVNGLKVLGKTFLSDSLTFGTETPAGTFTLNRTSGGSDFPSIMIQKNGVNIGQLKGKQNARQDIVVESATADGRAILATPSNIWGVVAHPNNQTSIGNSIKATGYTLSVDGDVMCEDLTMQNSNSWPDYVFEKDYNLMPLAEVKKFIETNKHLPNIPSAADIEKDGIKMAAMTKALMEKVEELTLYILKQQEEIEALRKKL